MKRLKFLLLLACFSLQAEVKEFQPYYLRLGKTVESPKKIAEQLEIVEKPPLSSGMNWGKCTTTRSVKKSSTTKGFYFYVNADDLLQIKGYTEVNAAGIRSKDGLALSTKIHPRLDMDVNVTTNDIFLRPKKAKQSFETSVAWKY